MEYMIQITKQPFENDNKRTKPYTFSVISRDVEYYFFKKIVIKQNLITQEGVRKINKIRHNQFFTIMDVLKKTLRKLSETEYKNLLQQVAGKKKNKPFIVMETARYKEIDDQELMNQLQVNSSAYYTLKSRLNSKIASILSKKVDNPISGLMEEVARVPANMYGNNREFSIRALVELEKQLKEYDLNSELITVYKTLAHLNLYTDDYEYYNTLYNKHVAFSLAVVKAEQHFYQFIRKIGQYQLTLDQSDLEEVIVLKRELNNICELYDSHRLFVLYNIVKIYFMCVVTEKRGGLKSREIEIENILNKMNGIFEKFPLDTFYQNIKPITNFLFFEYYQKTGNQVRSDFYLEKINSVLQEWSGKHSMSFFIVQFLQTKLEKFLADGNMDSLVQQNDVIESNFDADTRELYHYVSFKRYQSIIRFYQRDYAGAAKKINELRNNVSLRNCVHTDIECKLFQALQYCIMGEDGLCAQIIASLKRQIREREKQFESARLFIKILKSAMKPGEYRKKIKRINELWDQFTISNKGSYPVLTYLKFDENLIRKMTNPIKD